LNCIQRFFYFFYLILLDFYNIRTVKKVHSGVGKFVPGSPLNALKIDHPFKDYIYDVFDVMQSASHHTFQILTKRANRMLNVLREQEGKNVRL
jgi:hypothetical protein